MDQLSSPSAQALRLEFQQFAQEKVSPRAAELSQKQEFDRQSWNELLETSFFQLIIPKAFGGKGENWWEFTAALEGMASGLADGGFLLSLISQAGMIRALTTFGTPSQKREYFGRFLAGEISGTALAEPHTGTDLRNLQTVAVAEGEGFLLNGQKWNIAHASTGGFSLVLGRIPALGKRDLTLFIVDHQQPGFTAGKVLEKMGNRTIPNAGMEFRDLKLSKEHILGKPGMGLQVLGEVMAIDRIYYGWMGSQLLHPFLKEAKAFISQRESGGKPLSRHQHVQRKIADVLMGMEQARAVGIQALHQFLNEQPEAARNSSIAKLTGVQAFEKGARELLSIFGSEGYLSGDLSRIMQDALGWISVGGTEEAHRMNIFNQWMREE